MHTRVLLDEARASGVRAALREKMRENDGWDGMGIYYYRKDIVDVWYRKVSYRVFN